MCKIAIRQRLPVLLFIIAGDFIDAIPAIIIFMPIITDLTQATNIKPVDMGVVIILTLAFGLITPPYGLALLMASKSSCRSRRGVSRIRAGPGISVRDKLPHTAARRISPQHFQVGTR